MRVFLAGEGPTELGGWAHEPAYRGDAAGAVTRRGVLLALLSRAWKRDVEVVDAVLWKRIRKYRVGEHAAADERNVLGAAEHAVTLARRSGQVALAFTRDRDRIPDRERQVERAIAKVRAMWPELAVAGGCAVEEIEAWGLAVAGVERPETVRDGKRVLGERIGAGVDAFVAGIDSATDAEIARAREHSPSLERWMGRAEAVTSAVRAEP